MTGHSDKDASIKLDQTKQHTDFLRICHLIGPVREQTNLQQVVKVVRLIDPLIIGQDAVRPVCDVFDI